MWRVVEGVQGVRLGAFSRLFGRRKEEGGEVELEREDELVPFASSSSLLSPSSSLKSCSQPRTDELCSTLWISQKGVSKKGLTTLIESARLENPLVSIDSPVGEAQSSAAAKK